MPPTQECVPAGGISTPGLTAGVQGLQLQLRRSLSAVVRPPTPTASPHVDRSAITLDGIAQWRYLRPAISVVKGSFDQGPEPLTSVT